MHLVCGSLWFHHWKLTAAPTVKCSYPEEDAAVDADVIKRPNWTNILGKTNVSIPRQSKSDKDYWRRSEMKNDWVWPRLPGDGCQATEIKGKHKNVNIAKTQSKSVEDCGEEVKNLSRRNNKETVSLRCVCSINQHQHQLVEQQENSRVWKVSSCVSKRHITGALTSGDNNSWRGKTVVWLVGLWFRNHEVLGTIPLSPWAKRWPDCLQWMD